jgi:tRNA (guanine-N7-)-methyltransferase
MRQSGLSEKDAGPASYADKPAWRIETHFELRGLKLGHGVWDLLYRRI